MSNFISNQINYENNNENFKQKILIQSNINNKKKIVNPDVYYNHINNMMNIDQCSDYNINIVTDKRYNKNVYKCKKNTINNYQNISTGNIIYNFDNSSRKIFKPVLFNNLNIHRNYVYKDPMDSKKYENTLIEIKNDNDDSVPTWLKDTNQHRTNILSSIIKKKEINNWNQLLI
jgi:hypothetical protein